RVDRNHDIKAALLSRERNGHFVFGSSHRLVEFSKRWRRSRNFRPPLCLIAEPVHRGEFATVEIFHLRGEAPVAGDPTSDLLGINSHQQLRSALAGDALPAFVRTDNARYCGSRLT